MTRARVAPYTRSSGSAHDLLGGLSLHAEAEGEDDRAE